MNNQAALSKLWFARKSVLAPGDSASRGNALRPGAQIRLYRLVSVLLLAVLLSTPSGAAPFARQFRYVQPDGTTVHLWGRGDDFGAVFETLDGYTVVFEPGRRAYCFAQLSTDGATLESTGALVGQANPAGMGLVPHLRAASWAAKSDALNRRAAWERATRTGERWEELKTAARAAGTQLSAPPSWQTVGVKCGVTVLIDFEDERGGFSREEVTDFLNGDAYTGFGNNGSVKQYFLDVSNSRLTFTNAVTPYITIPNSIHPRSWYNDPTQDCFQRGQQLVRDALAVMKALPNFTNDFLPVFKAASLSSEGTLASANFLVAGRNSGVWGKGIWGQTSALSFFGATASVATGRVVNLYQLLPMEDRLTIMAFCHENGHLLCGFPDIYDYGMDSSSGAGYFCLMALGQFSDTNPAQVCAYLKAAAGWAVIQDLPAMTNFLASLSAEGPDFNRFIRFRKPSVPTEYFLLENRQKAGRDGIIPGGGIVIWHVDELGNRDSQEFATNNYHRNYEISLEQADSQWHLQTFRNAGNPEDLFYAGNASPGYENLFSDLTSPSAQWWNGARSGLALSDFSSNAITMSFEVRTEVPVIRFDPQDRTVIAGQTASMGFFLINSVARGIQWYKDSMPLAQSDRIAGTDSALLRISAASEADTGCYQAVVVTDAGEHTTRAAKLTVIPDYPLTNNSGSGSTTLVPDGVDLVAFNSSISLGKTGDSFRYAYQTIQGDFDARVRVHSLSRKTDETRAGLMLRSTLDANAQQISVLQEFGDEGPVCRVLSRPQRSAMNQQLFSRISVGSLLSTPENWLRLRRQGCRITAYHSYDGTNWFWLKSLECDLGETPFLGLALASGPNPPEPAVASFRGYRCLRETPSSIAIAAADGIAREGSFDDAHVAVHASRNGPALIKLAFRGAPTNGLDYVAAEEVEIPAGTNVGILPLRAINNTEPSLPKKVTVLLAGQTSWEIVQPAQTAILILDDEQITGGLCRQTYTNLGGVGVIELTTQLTNSTAITDISCVREFENDTCAGPIFSGQVLSGYLLPPETGDYTFYLASTSSSELWLSTDETVEHKRRVATVAGFTPFRWYSGSGNHSAPIPLEKGRAYYVETRHKQLGGESEQQTGFFSAAWHMPGGSVPADGSEPIPGEYLSYSLPVAPAVELVFPTGQSTVLRGKTGGSTQCVVESSNDLTNWLPLTTNNLPSRVDLNALEPFTPAQQTRFYRAVLK